MIKQNSNTTPNSKKNISQKDDIFAFNSLDEIKKNLELNICVNDTNKEVIEKIIRLENEENNMKLGENIIVNDKTKKNMKQIIQKRKEAEKPMKMVLKYMININLIILLKKVNLNLLMNTVNL